MIYKKTNKKIHMLRSIKLTALAAMLMFSTSCITLPDSARDVFQAAESASDNSYKKDSE